MAVIRHWTWKDARTIEGPRKPGRLSPAVWYWEHAHRRFRPWVLRDISGVIGTYKTEANCRRAAIRHADLLWSETIGEGATHADTN